MNVDNQGKTTYKFYIAEQYGYHIYDNIMKS